MKIIYTKKFWTSTECYVKELYEQLAIFIDLRNSLERQWQDFCHELAHVLLHIGIQDKLPQMYIEYQEHKDNQFMYHAAIPTFMLDDLDLCDCTIQNIRLIQQLFQVEEEFAGKRFTYSAVKVF